VDRFDLRRIGVALGALTVLLVAGTIGFHSILNESWDAAFYRTVVTASLTGLDSTPRGLSAEALTVGVVLAGVALFGFLAAQLADAITGGALHTAWKENRRRKMINQLRDHFIICGYGRVGRRAAAEFSASGQPFVVLDFSADALAAARERQVLYIEGTGAEDEDLDKAGLERARGILASSDSDADNLYITLSARARRQDLMIVARASDAEAERKLQLAGADRVVQPYSSAGVEMAKLALKPQVSAFLELVSTHAGPDLRFEEIEVSPVCPQAGRTIRDLRIRHETGALVVALRKADGSFDTTPNPDVRLDVGDVLIAIGTESELLALEELFAPAEPVAS
jgi:voltage-gated potassium channel